MSELVHDEEVLGGSPEAREAQPVARVGAQLKAAREAAGLQVPELARLLRLGERQIEALEQGQWSSLPGSTFVRGFVRNYARAVQLDPTPLLAQLEGETKLEVPNLELPVSTHVTMPGQSRALNKDVLTVVAGLVLVLGAVVSYFFLPDEFWVQKPPAEMAVAAPAPVATPGEPLFPPADAQQAGAVVQEGATPPPLPVEARQEAAVGVATPSAPGVPVAPATSVAPVAVPPATPPVVPAAPVAVAPVSAAPQAASVVAMPLPAGGVTASFSFTRDSWVEVRDKDGNLIVSRLHPAGTSRDISGVAPLSIVVGNASHVKLQFKGKDVPLQPNAESDVARLTLQ